ncbi:MAG: DUF1573 domain-containing protein [Pirellulales bacterium]|nr:DUF1573 domain-containing protein [Pirellulales bacterium]
MFLTLLLGAVCQADEFDLSKDQISKLTKLGVVSLSSKSEVKLTFPEGYMDDEIRGAVLLVNDSDETATVSTVKTSCGCTAAIPVEKSIEAGKQNILVFHYRPKAVGDAKIEAAFAFGGKDFVLRGVAKTLPRFQQSTASLTFDEDEVELVLTKHTPTKVDRFVIFPSSVKYKDLKDSDDTVRIKLIRPEENPKEILFSPAFGEKTYKQMRMELNYKGVVEVLPRHVVAHSSKVRFFLRGDTEPLADATNIVIGDQEIDCRVSQRGRILAVEFEYTFAPGDHRPTTRIGEMSFPLSVKVLP